MNTNEIFAVVESTLGLTLSNVSRMTIDFLFEGQEIEISRCFKEEQETAYWLVTSILSKIYDRGFYDGAQDHKHQVRELLGLNDE